MIKEILIECTGSDNLALNEMFPFQDKLKILTDENKQRLKNSIIKYNFSFPFFCWKDKTGKVWLNDGHSRNKVLPGLEKEGYKIPEKYPVIYVIAKNKKEAAEKLLIQSSQYGVIDEQGLYNFQQMFKLDLPSLNLNLPEIDISFEVIDNNDYLSQTDHMRKPDSMTSANGIKLQIGNFTYYSIETDFFYNKFKTFESILLDSNEDEIHIIIKRMLNENMF